MTTRVDNITALLRASSAGHLKIVKALVKAGADVNQGDITPLMEACDAGHLDIVKFLVGKDADINVVSKYGDTAMKLAADKPKILRFLEHPTGCVGCSIMGGRRTRSKRKASKTLRRR
jgi:hypothetical protein